MLADFVAGSIERPWGNGKPLSIDRKRLVKVALGTGDTGKGRERWGIVHSQVEALLECARNKANAASTLHDAATTVVSSLSVDQLQALAGQAKHDVLAEHEAQWLEPKRMDPKADIIFGILSERRSSQNEPERLRAKARALSRVIDERQVQQALKSGKLGLFDEDLAARTIKRGDNDDPLRENVVSMNSEIMPSELTTRLAENRLENLSESDKRRAAGTILKAKASAFHAIRRQNAGEPYEVPVRPSAPVTDILNGAAASESNAPTLTQMHAVWKQHKRPTAKTVDDNWLYVNRFSSLYGDKPIDQITRADIRAFRDLMSEFPRTVPHDKRHWDVKRLVEWARKHPAIRRLSRVTVNAKVLGSLSTLFDKAVSEGYIEQNPCSKLKHDIKVSDSIQRKGFGVGELKKMLASPIFASTAKISKGGCGAAAYWMPLLALFAGGRVEELAQLLLSDVQSDGSIHWLNITTLDEDDEDSAAAQRQHVKTIKTEAGKRRIPLHHILVHLGFLDYVESMKKAGHRRLFPLMEAYRGRYSKKWAKWWARYQDKHITARREYVFHSFRHSFATALRHVPVQKPMIQALLGHAETDTTDGYGDGYSVQVLNVELQKMLFDGVNFNAIKRKWY